VQVNVGCDPFAGDVYCSFLTGPVTEGDFFAAGAPFNLLVPGFVELDPNTLEQSGRLFGMHGAYSGIPPAPSGNGILAYIEFTRLGTGDSVIDGDSTVVDGDGSHDGDVSAVPEPGTLAMLATGFAWLGGGHLFMKVRRRRPAAITCGVLASLFFCGSARAQLVSKIPLDNVPVAMPAPTSYPATVAPTGVGPYYAPPAWSQTLAPNVRFLILSNFNGHAVLDRETGLIWSRQSQVEAAARFAGCFALAGQYGWRLPSVSELQSLIDASQPISLQARLPVGHPFLLHSLIFWTNEITLGTIANRMVVDFRTGGSGGVRLDSNSPTEGVMCVRGA